MEEIQERIKLVEKKIEILQRFLKLVKSMKISEHRDYSEIIREIDELFCDAYHSHPETTDPCEYHFPDCAICPLVRCYYRDVIEDLNDCYESRSERYSDCRACELLRSCKNVYL